MRVDDIPGKGTSGMDKFGSVIDRLNMKLRSKFFNILRASRGPVHTNNKEFGVGVVKSDRCVYPQGLCVQV
jgi:hypothetical protein